MFKLFKPAIASCFTLAISVALFTSCNSNQSQSSSDPIPEIVTDKLFLPISSQKDPKADSGEKWQAVPEGVQVSFVSTDVRSNREGIPKGPVQRSWEGAGWKGERIAVQVLLWSKVPVQDVQLVPAKLTGKDGTEMSAENIKAQFVNFVLTDEFGNGCGKRKPADFDSSLVADIIDHYAVSTSIEKNTVQPVWVSIDIPANQAPGVYKGTINVNSNEGTTELALSIRVVDRVLPPPAEWAFHLDLWQNPYAVARLYDVPVWSEDHFDILRPHLELLANAGQKCITTAIIDRPWNSQTFDPFRSMVKWTLHKDGAWSYDYSDFDRWVEFAMSCGITEQINCYTMIPWHLRFEYFDEVSGELKAVEAEPGTDEYNNHWSGMLKDFTSHLKEKGWFEKTTISMDERPEEAMLNTMALLQEAAPGLKVALAGGYHPKIEADLYDYCIASEHHYPQEVLGSRNIDKKFSTFYTCCVESYPNTFTFSPPAESAWLGWYAAAEGFGGYLRWAYNSWVEDPLHDSRFRSWPAGDTYVVYPGARTSIRFERLREGIQDFEKIRTLREEWPEGSTERKVLEGLLGEFKIENLAHTPAGEMINKGRAVLNQ